MNPVIFGDPATPLYGVYHPPQPDARSGARDHGVVLCNAFGQEYMRAHRAYRQLALLLTRKGFHVLRFDYRGTGDSSGDLTGVAATDWLIDIGLAVDELRETSGVQQVSLIGLRLGALLAACASGSRDDVDRLVLWDPVETGAAYEDELLAEIAAEVPSEYSPSPGNGEGPDGELYYNGFEMPRGFRESMRSLALVQAGAARVGRILQAVSHETAAFTRVREGLRGHPGYRYQFTAAPHDWNYVDKFGGILLPQPVIQAIVNWMENP